MGRLVPAGTGMRWYRDTRIPTPEVPLPREEQADVAVQQEVAVEMLQAMEVTPPENALDKSEDSE